MTTNVVRLALRPEARTIRVPESREGWIQRGVTRIGQWICGLQGHDTLLDFGPNRVRLRCVACGHTSPGWTTESRAPVLRFHGDASHHRLAKG